MATRSTSRAQRAWSTGTQPPSTKFVVTGTPGVAARSTSRCSAYAASNSSEVNRRKSSAWAGSARYCVRRGGKTWAQSV